MHKLKVQNGDLVLGPNNQLATVRGREKLVQDLTLFLMEPIGTSYLTPRFGSTLNGMSSRDSMGRQEATFVGHNIDEVRVAEIAAEIDRVLSVYQQGQVNAIKDAKSNGMLYMFSRGEILNTINGIESDVFEDGVVVRANLTTGTGENIDVIARIGEDGGINIGAA